MRGIDTSGVVAAVQDVKVADLSNEQEKRNTMGILFLSIRHFAVASIVRAYPFPTSRIDLRYVGHKQFTDLLNRLVASRTRLPHTGAGQATIFAPTQFHLSGRAFKGCLAMLTGAWYGWLSHLRNLSFLLWSGPLACASTFAARFHFSINGDVYGSRL